MVLRDVDALLMAERAWFVYQILRAAHMIEAARVSEEDAQLQRRLVEEAHTGQMEFRAAAAPLLDGLYRYFRLMEVCPGGVGLTIKDRKQTPVEVAAAARTLAEQVGALAGASVIEPDTVELSPRIGWYDVTDDRRHEITRRLRWILAHDEKLLAVAHADSPGLLSRRRFTIFTSRRLLSFKEGSFPQEGRVHREIPWTDVAKVGRSEKPGPAGGPDVIVSADQDYKLSFTKNVPSDAADRLVGALRAYVADGRRRLPANSMA